MVVKKPKRPKRRQRIPLDIEESVLTKCHRRCAFCYAFSDSSPRGVRGQIAHINRKSDDNREVNLAFLCMDHHDQYDSKPSQSKGLTQRELKNFKNRVEEVEARRERCGQEQAFIQVEADFGAISKTTSEKILKSIAELALTNCPVVLKNQSGTDQFTVSLDSRDLASLMEADDKGLLKPIDVKSVRPLIVESERTYEFYPEFPMFGTFSKKDHIRIFERSQFREGFDFKHLNWIASTYVNPHNASLATISIGTLNGTKTELTETLVIRKSDDVAWQPNNPVEFLKSFLKKNGETLRLRNNGAQQKFLLDTEIRRIKFMSGSHTSDVFAAVDIDKADGSVVLYHSEEAGFGRFHLLHLFSLSMEVILEMRKNATSESWF